MGWKSEFTYQTHGPQTLVFSRDAPQVLLLGDLEPNSPVHTAQESQLPALQTL